MEGWLFQNGKIYRKGTFLPGDLLVCGSRIASCGGESEIPAGVKTVDVRGAYLVPGFLDVHTHGGMGIDVNHGTAEELIRLGAFFARHGTTGWLCSIMTDTREATLRQIRRSVEAMKSNGAKSSAGAALLGIHLEGPFLAAEYGGAMPPELLLEGDTALFREYQEAAEGNIRYLTVAPEIPGVTELVRQISEETTVAIGHSGAGYDAALACIAAGARACTHTFNAMRLFHQHEPAIMGAALESDIYCEAICDGRHLHPASVRLMLKCKGYERVIAVTDSISAAGLPDGMYQLGVNRVEVKNGDAKLAGKDVRAGSTLTQDQALRNLVTFTGEPPEKVLPLLTENPARLFGWENKGSLEPGKDADLVVLDRDLSIRATMVMGEMVYIKNI